jgi:hypothetical protein
MHLFREGDELQKVQRFTRGARYPRLSRHVGHIYRRFLGPGDWIHYRTGVPQKGALTCFPFRSDTCMMSGSTYVAVRPPKELSISMVSRPDAALFDDGMTLTLCDRLS